MLRDSGVRARCAILVAILGAVALSALAVHEASAFRGATVLAAEAERDRSLATHLLLELEDLNVGARVFLMTGDFGYVAELLEARRAGRDALSSAEAHEAAFAAVDADGAARHRMIQELERLVRAKQAAEDSEISAGWAPLTTAALRRRYRDDAADVVRARRLVQAIEARELLTPSANDPRAPWDDSGLGVLLAVGGLAGACVLVMLAGSAVLLYELRLRQKAEAEARESKTRLEGTLAGLEAPQGLLRRSHLELEADVKDRTEALLRSEEGLRRAQKMEAVGRLAGGVAHDFNNLLTVIRGYAHFIAEGPDQRARADAREILGVVETAAGMTKRLLGLSSGRTAAERRMVPLNGIVEGVDKLLRRVIGERVRLETRLSAAAPWVEADPSELEQVLLNLALNARDAMPQGGRLSLSTGVAASGADGVLRAGRYAVLQACDEGCGIPFELQERIFEPFFTTKGADKGTGLGLATVYAIARRLGGDVRVLSEPGRGAAFHVFLPLAEPGADRRPTGA